MMNLWQQHKRLIDIKFAATAKPLESTRKQSDVDYSAQVIYEI